ncbi:hypothetical protein EUA76_02095 [TM7 phylum sp. oral taxon 350]|nr:hypothetical protein EUA76_02095 [TM7 phylum sp. oral taxon 350]
MEDQQNQVTNTNFNTNNVNSEKFSFSTFFGYFSKEKRAQSVRAFSKDFRKIVLFMKIAAVLVALYAVGSSIQIGSDVGVLQSLDGDSNSLAAALSSLKGMMIMGRFNDIKMFATANAVMSILLSVFLFILAQFMKEAFMYKEKENKNKE